MSTWCVRLARRLMLKRYMSIRPVVQLTRAQCSQIFFLYGGMDAIGKVSGMGLFTFLQATGLGNRNLTWLRDPYLDNFRRGISPDVPDVPALEAWHRQYLEARPAVRDIYTLGTSSGAYGALLYGHLLQAKTVWAFSPRTVHPHGDAAARAELRERLLTHNGVTTYEVCYAAGNKRDRVFVDTLADCPGVRIHAYRGYGSTHFLLNHLADADKLRSLFPPYAAAAQLDSA